MMSSLKVQLSSIELWCSIYLATFCLWSMLARFSIYASPRGGVFIYGSYIIIFLYLLIAKSMLFNRDNMKYALAILLPFLFAYLSSYFINNLQVESTPF